MKLSGNFIQTSGPNRMLLKVITHGKITYLKEMNTIIILRLTTRYWY